jgi:hypothetical protein
VGETPWRFKSSHPHYDAAGLSALDVSGRLTQPTCSAKSIRRYRARRTKAAIASVAQKAAQGSLPQRKLLLPREKLPSAGNLGLGYKNLSPPAKVMPCVVERQVSHAMRSGSLPRGACPKNLGFNFVGDDR